MSKLPVKILVVVEDNNFGAIFTDHLKDHVESVLNVKDGKEAQDIILFEMPDLVLCDVKISGVHGIELLHWLKRNSSEIPMILMTDDKGFIDEKEAKELGAYDLLYRPFKIEKILKIIDHLFLGEDFSLADFDTEVDELLLQKFEQVLISDFISGKILSYNLYLLNNPMSVRKVLSKGDAFNREKFISTISKSEEYLYLEKNDYHEYIKVVLKLISSLHANSNFDLLQEYSIWGHGAQLVVDGIYINSCNRIDFNRALSYLKVLMNTFQNHEDIYKLLKFIYRKKGFLYAHLIAVSLYAGLMARELKWDSPKTLNLLFLSGMLHDFGLKFLDSKFSHLAEIDMTPEEFKLFKTHPITGIEKLSQIGISKEILQIITQHHEFLNGTGFPFGLGQNHIYPLAQIMHVSDKFIEILFPKEMSADRGPREIVSHMMIEFKAKLNPQMMAALEKVLH